MKLDVHTFSTSKQRQVITCDAYAVTSPKECHVSGCCHEPVTSVAQGAYFSGERNDNRKYVCVGRLMKIQILCLISCAFQRSLEPILSNTVAPVNQEATVPQMEKSPLTSVRNKKPCDREVPQTNIETVSIQAVLHLFFERFIANCAHWERKVI